MQCLALCLMLHGELARQSRACVHLLPLVDGVCCARLQYPPLEQRKVRTFLADSTATGATQLQHHKHELAQLSPPLAADIARHLHRKWLPEVKTPMNRSVYMRFALVERNISITCGWAVCTAGPAAAAASGVQMLCRHACAMTVMMLGTEARALTAAALCAHAQTALAGASAPALTPRACVAVQMICQVWWLRSEDNTFIIRLALLIGELFYAPHDPIFEVHDS